MKRIFLFLMALIFINFSNINMCLAKNEKNTDTVVIGLDADFPPMGFVDENGEIVGFDVDLARASLEKMGKKVKFLPIDWDSKDMEIKNGNIDCIWNGFTYSEDRAKNYTLSKPYMKTKPVVVVRYKDYISVNNLENLYVEKTVCLQKGALAQDSLLASDVLEKAKNVVYLGTMLDCLNEVKLQKVDATIVDEPIARYYFKKNNYEKDFRILEKDVSAEDYVVAVKKGNEELINIIEEGMEKIVESGEAKKISEKWFGKDLVCFNRKIDLLQKGLSENTEESKNENKNYGIFKNLSQGLLLTLKLFFVCLVFSIPLGLMICLLRRKNLKVLNILIDLYTLVIRGTPLLLQIFFIFYGLPLMFPLIKINNRFIAGAIAFIVNYTAYFSEIFRGGINSIPKGQWEAIKVLKIPKFKAIRKIIVPQSLKASLPPICNETITLVKDTALVFSIGLIELLSATKNIVNTSANVMIYAVSAVIYLAICSILNAVFKLLEKKFNYKN